MKGELDNTKPLNFEKVQQIALGVLKNIHQVCEDQNLRYTLAYGTLIGAIRHKGFIPWDDDIDIMMPRPDFDKLVEYYNTHETGPYKLMNLNNTSGYPYFNTRVCDTRTYIDVTNEDSYGMGIFVDVCAMDGLGSNWNEACAIMSKSKKLCSSMFLATRNKFHIGLTKGIKKKLLKYPAYLITHALGRSFFIRKMEQLVKNRDYDSSSYVGCLLWSTYSPQKEVIKKEWIENFEKRIFEDSDFFVSSYYHEILTQIYGDYMKLPPEKDRIYHHLYYAYKK